jgi:cyanate permease
VAFQIVVEERIPKFEFNNFLNIAVFLGIILMAFGCFLAWMLKVLDEKGFSLAAKKISWLFILWYNLM